MWTDAVEPITVKGEDTEEVGEFMYLGADWRYEPQKKSLGEKYDQDVQL